MKMQGGFIRNLIVIFVPLLVFACAPRAEFHTIPQKGAKRTGTYPRFSEKPQAETGQFSEEERARLVRELEGDAQRLRGSDHLR